MRLYVQPSVFGRDCPPIQSTQPQESNSQPERTVAGHMEIPMLGLSHLAFPSTTLYDLVQPLRDVHEAWPYYTLYAANCDLFSRTIRLQKFWLGYTAPMSSKAEISRLRNGMHFFHRGLVCPGCFDTSGNIGIYCGAENFRARYVPFSLRLGRLMSSDASLRPPLLHHRWQVLETFI